MTEGHTFLLTLSERSEPKGLFMSEVSVIETTVVC